MENGEKQEIPQIIKDVGFDFDWSEPKVWALEVPVEEININEELKNIERLLKEALKYKRVFGVSGVKSRLCTVTAVSLLDTIKDKKDIQLFELGSIDCLLDKAKASTKTKHYSQRGRKNFDEAHSRLKKLMSEYFFDSVKKE